MPNLTAEARHADRQGFIVEVVKVDVNGEEPYELTTRSGSFDNIEEAVEDAFSRTVARRTTGFGGRAEVFICDQWEGVERGVFTITTTGKVGFCRTSWHYKELVRGQLNDQASPLAATGGPFYAQYRAADDQPWKTHGHAERLGDASGFMLDMMREAGLADVELIVGRRDLKLGNTVTAPDGAQFRVTLNPDGDA